MIQKRFLSFISERLTKKVADISYVKIGKVNSLFSYKNKLDNL